ncbi:MAG: 2-dehydro-3-deoxy-6-phosphogalactonate aldolase [Betaproteobacteria bacterium AqS2]|uniref:2-dehydro-3-deoxy-6-phosphogalactonate aldolase n=1 Tax=Candidatus Amphirhobacter heronislandensis TaxID=1732024 RepID=A0A930UHU1_9GAMM|nr:2-dehydro-3-deoxy-6-phosphogalactonate aldolase [Betaproteobacteria bacterium AqS2]
MFDKAANPLIAILRGIAPDEAVAVGKELVAAGVSIMEVTMNSPEPLKSIELLAEACGADALVGAGTVLAPAEVEQVARAGGRLVVSPNFDPAVVKATKEQGLASVPGCLTPTEMFAALAAGADMLKVFPGDVATPPVIKGYRAVLPKEAKIAVTGGVNADNLAAYRQAGADCFGIGSALYKPGKTAAEVGESAKEFVAACGG